VVFEMELIKQVEINIDYILELIKKYHQDHVGNKEVLVDIGKAIDSSVELRNKKDLIEQFIAALDPQAVVDEDWQRFIEGKRSEELDKIIGDEGLDSEKTYDFVRNAFRDGAVVAVGTGLAKILPPISRFTPTDDHGQKRKTVVSKLKAFFERFYDIAGRWE